MEPDNDALLYYPFILPKPLYMLTMFVFSFIDSFYPRLLSFIMFLNLAMYKLIDYVKNLVIVSRIFLFILLTLFSPLSHIMRGVCLYI